MRESFVRRLWNGLAPPSRQSNDVVVKHSALHEFWQAVKPPPAVEKRRFNPQQRRLLRMVAYAASVLALGGVGAGVYLYVLEAPNRAEATFQDGMKLMSPGKYPDAIRKFDSALGTWDGHARAHLNRGIAEQILGQNDSALRDFEKAVALDSGLAEAHTARGVILRATGDIAGAIDSFTKSINLDPTVDGYYQRGQLFEAKGEHAKALEDFDRAVSMNRYAPYVYSARSRTRRALGDLTGSAEDQGKADEIINKR